MSRHRKCILTLLLCCPVFLSGVASAQTIKTEIKTSTPLPAGATTTINTTVMGFAANLAKDDAEARKQARNSIIEQSDTASNNASPAYQSAYATSVATALQPLLAAKNSRQVRLNAAIAIGEVASHVSRTDSADVFLNIATLLLSSNDFESQLWGLKTAKYVLASYAMKNKPLAGFDKKLVAAVQKSRQAGDLMEEAYQALTYEPLRTRNEQAIAQGNPPPVPNLNTIMGLTIGDLFDLVEWRITIYKAGAPPNNPQAEWVVCSIFPGTYFAVINNPQIKNRALKALGDLACQQLKALIVVMNNGGGGQLQQDLINAVQSSGRGINAIGQWLGNNAALIAAGNNVGQVNGNTNVGKLGDYCTDLTAAFQGVGVTLSP